MNLSKKNILETLEKIFVLSPFFLIFAVIFNVPDTKFLFSRLVILVSIYCAVRFRKIWFEEFVVKLKLTFFLLVFISYFFIMQYSNDGNSDLPRAVLYLLFYFVFIPLNLLTSRFGFYMVSIAGVCSGLSTMYECFFLGTVRTGYLVSNPIPFSFYVGTCLVLSYFMYFIQRNNNRFSYADVLLLSISTISSLSAIILSQTRATFLSILLVLLFVSFFLFMRGPSVKRFLIVFTSLGVIVFSSWNIPEVRYRVNDALNQIKMYSSDNYDSSTGIRVKLWYAGIDIASDNLITGHSKLDVNVIAKKNIEGKLFPDFLEPYLVHPNPNLHNQFIQNLVDSGLVGLLLVVLLIFSPLVLSLKSKSFTMRLFGGSFTIFSITCFWFDSLFLYNQTVILYGALVILTFGCCYHESLENNR